MTGRTSFALLSLVDLLGAAAELFAIEGLHGLQGSGVVHFHEAEAAEATGLTVIDELHGVNFTVLGENVAEIIFGGAESDVTDVNRLRLAIKLLKKTAKSVLIEPEQKASGQPVPM